MEMRAIAKAKVGSFNLVSQGNDKQQDELTFAKLKENKVAKENELFGMNDEIEELEKRAGKFWKWKGGSKNKEYSGFKEEDYIEEDKVSKKKVIKDKLIGKFKKQGDNEFGLSADDDPDGRDLVDELLLRVFNLLKGSGFINDIIRMSLTDPRVRLGMIDMTIRLLNAEVIPWDDIFIALKRHGLAIDVIKFTFTDAQTRVGLAAFVIELLPALVTSGALDLRQILETVPRLQEELIKMYNGGNRTHNSTDPADSGNRNHGFEDSVGSIIDSENQAESGINEHVIPKKNSSSINPISKETPTPDVPKVTIPSEKNNSDNYNDQVKNDGKESKSSLNDKEKEKPMNLPDVPLIDNPKNWDDKTLEEKVEEYKKLKEQYDEARRKLVTNENLNLIRDHTYFNNPEKLKNIKPLFPKTGVKYTNNTSNGTVGNHAAPYPRVRIFYDGTFVPNYPVDFKPPIAGGPLTNFEPNSNSIKPNAEPTVGVAT